MEKILKYGDTTYSIILSGQTNPVRASIDGEDFACEINKVSECEWIVTREGIQTRLFLTQNREGETFVQTGGRMFRLSPVEDDFGAGSGDPAASGRLTAAMPGRVIKVLVEPGQEVQKDQPVIIMESMKMEITQSAPFHGKVEEVNAKSGQQVDAGTVLVRIEPISQAEKA